MRSLTVNTLACIAYTSNQVVAAPITSASQLLEAYEQPPSHPHSRAKHANTYGPVPSDEELAEEDEESHEDNNVSSHHRVGHRHYHQRRELGPLVARDLQKIVAGAPTALGQKIWNALSKQLDPKPLRKTTFK